MKAQDRLAFAREATRSGRYEEALREFSWFHDHALDEEEALYGVRLSYALAYWRELGEVHPPALDALKAVRDQKSVTLARGEGNRELFHDVESINECLNDQQSTYQLFLRLLDVSPNSANACSDLALPSIVRAKDFALARTLIGDPESNVLKWSRELNRDIEDLARKPPRKAPAREAYVHVYAARVGMLLSILNGVREPALADSVRSNAMASINDGGVRAEVEIALTNG